MRRDTVRYGGITARAICGDNAAAAVVEHDGIVAYGDSKRNKGERHNADVGLDLAMARAFYDLGDQLTERAYINLEEIS